MFKQLLKAGFVSIVLTVVLQFILPLSGIVEGNLVHVPQASRADSNVAISNTSSFDKSHEQYIDQWNDTYTTIFTTHSESTSNNSYTWEVVDENTHNSEIAYYHSFDQEISKYNDSLLKNSGVRQVIFVDNLEFHNGQAVLGFADILSGTIYYNIDGARAQTGLLKSTMHHEIAHVMFYSVYGSGMYNLSNWPAAPDNSNQNDTYNFPNEGYVSNYSQTSMAEDMAEVFAFIMTDEYQVELAETMQSDGIIAAKVTIIHQAVETIDPKFILPV